MKTQDAESLERLSEILNIEDFRGIKKTDLTFTKAKSPEGKTENPLQGIQGKNYLLLTKKYLS